ncbi:hypothetical protein [Acinetobacter sp. TSRC1-2]|uniref:hypothetical protein n=1 Tax=unclassified Acinetobacter TaxID=196816 RepID=UPI003CEB0D7B
MTRYQWLIISICILIYTIKGLDILAIAFTAHSVSQSWGLKGIISQRYQITAMMSMLAGTVLSSIFMVLEGYKGWRDMGTEVAELMLIA